jgi:hypothetical protein
VRMRISSQCDEASRVLPADHIRVLGGVFVFPSTIVLGDIRHQ